MRALLAQARADGPALLLLGVLVAVTALLGAFVPRHVEAAEQDALTASVALAPTVRREVRATWQGAPDHTAIADAGAELAAAFPPALGGGG